MSEIRNGWLILSEQERKNFEYQMFHPNTEVIKRRDAFFKKLDKMNMTINDDGSGSIDMSDIIIELKEKK